MADSSRNGVVKGMWPKGAKQSAQHGSVKDRRHEDQRLVDEGKQDTDWLRPPQQHIDAAIGVEGSVTKDQMALYMDCMNDKPMTERVTGQELRDGCILTFHVFLKCLHGCNYDVSSNEFVKKIYEKA